MTSGVPCATTNEEAHAYIGATVYFNPEHPDNEDDMMISMIGNFSGEVIDSFMIEESPNSEHAFAVEFMTPVFSGMIRPVSAERFLLKANS